MRGVFLDSQTIDQDDIDFSALTSTLSDWQLYPLTKIDEVQTRIQTADIVVTNKVKLTAAHIEAAPHLRFICSAATGYDQIDIQAAKKKGIAVSNVPVYSTSSVIQHTVGLLINLASRISDYDTLVKQGAWVGAPFFCLQTYRTFDLAGKVLGIIGYGTIGQGVAAIAQALGMKVLIAARAGQETGAARLALAELLPQVDFLSLHCPLTPETHHIISEKTLMQMKPGSYLINTARGGLVDEQALAMALKSYHLAGAAIDVLSKEPPEQDAPLLDPSIPHLVVTPHVAWATQEARQRLLGEVALNIRAFQAGQTRNSVVKS